MRKKKAQIGKMGVILGVTQLDSEIVVCLLMNVIHQS